MDLISALEKYSLDQFESDLNSWLKNGTAIWFIHGNFTDTEALEIVGNAKDIFKIADSGVKDIAANKTLKLKEGTATLYQQPLTDKENDYDCCLTYYQCVDQRVSENMKMAVCNTLVHTFIAVPFHEQLKNTERFTQVAMREALFNDRIGFWFLTTSDKQSSEYQIGKINEFLTRTRQSIQYFDET